MPKKKTEANIMEEMERADSAMSRRRRRAHSTTIPTVAEPSRRLATAFRSWAASCHAPATPWLVIPAACDGVDDDQSAR